MEGPKPLLTEFGIHPRFESCGLKLVIGLVRLESLKPRFVDSRFESFTPGFAKPIKHCIATSLYCKDLDFSAKCIILYSL